MITDWWLGLTETPADTARVVCRCDSAESVTINGDDEQTPALSDDYIVTFDFGGGSFVLEQGASRVTGTAPLANASEFSFAAISCLGYKKDLPHGDELSRKGLAFFAMLGDDIYVDQPAKGDSTTNPGTDTWNGETIKSISWMRTDNSGVHPTDAEYAEAYYAHYRAYYRSPGFLEFLHTTPQVKSTDDHTWPGNDGARNAGVQSVGGLNYHAGSAFCSSQADADNQWQIGLDTYAAWAKGNPVSSTVGDRTVLETPLEGAERLYYDFTIGNTLFLVLDLMAERHTPQTDVELPSDPYTADRDGQANNTVGTWPSGKHIMSEEQFTWLETTIKNTTATFKVILSSKSVLGTQDSWSRYDVDRNRLLAFLKAQTDWVVPGGAFAISGDVHQPEVWYDSTNEHFNINCAPSGNNLTANGAPLRVNEIYRPDASDVGEISFRACVVCDVTADYIEVKLHDEAMRVRWRGRILAGVNTLSYSERNFVSISQDLI